MGPLARVAQGSLPEPQAGDPVGEREAARIADAFRKPYTYSRVHAAELFDDVGFCERAASGIDSLARLGLPS